MHSQYDLFHFSWTVPPETGETVLAYRFPPHVLTVVCSTGCTTASLGAQQQINPESYVLRGRLLCAIFTLNSMFF